MQISFLVTPNQDPCLPKKKLPEIITFDPSKANVKKPNWMGLKKRQLRNQFPIVELYIRNVK